MSYTDSTVQYLSRLLFAAAIGMLSAAALNTTTVRADEPAPAKADDAAATKAKILDSKEWLAATYEFDEWLSVQVIYDKPAARKLRSHLQDKVKRMSANELRVFLFELQDKLKILNSVEAYQARAWAQDYLDKASDSAAAEFRKKLPDVATMTAAQLKQALEDNQEQRANSIAGRKAFDKLRDEQVAVMREMQRREADASLRASNFSGGDTHPGNWGGSLAPRPVTRYPGVGAGGYRWGGWRW